MAATLLLSLGGCASVRQTLGKSLISDQAEIDLGRQVADQVLSQYRVHPDPILQSYVSDIAEPLVQASLVDRQGVTYSITLLDEPEQVNAFALPGGPIFVFSGLLLLADDEAEVAGVLAHEIGHIVGRHSANQMATKVGVDALLGMALGEQPGEVARLAAELGAGGTFAQFSRDDERESDEFGVAYTIAAGYDPIGLLSFFEKLRQLESGGGNDALGRFFASHPATDERIRRLQKRIERAGSPGGERGEARHKLMVRRLR
ncbi:MAG: M48 family metalloprotease [Gemmatimonadetes bacterium]|nr:M48 family metalloprotease [Gemmatimonadota bacterium]MBT6147026.1 M48 family metalloprotease [Gemmatimonadota bacterium]MBT7863455.1 M48 family metalloprotease [Gemmatimonadota bacterium]